MPETLDDIMTRTSELLTDRDMAALSTLMAELSTTDAVRMLERVDSSRRAVLFRLLPKDEAVAVFERFDATVRGELFESLRSYDVIALFEGLDPDDRVELLDELPSNVAHRLLVGLSPDERALTAPMMGYDRRSVGRRMSPEFVRLRTAATADDALDAVRRTGSDAESVYLLPITDDHRTLLGVVTLADLATAAPSTPVGDLYSDHPVVEADSSAEEAARLCFEHRSPAVVVVDSEQRLIGILTLEQSSRILEEAEDEDAARAGGSEPLRRPYLSTPVLSIVRSRVVWLLVLALSAILTVQVLEIFEHALAAVVTLALFIPLLTGTGGNTGSQAATTVTRALALGDVRPRDIAAVLFREVRVGATMGAMLGTLGFVIAGLVYDWHLGVVIGTTLLSICTLAATVGGAMPLIAKKIGVDPAVFSTPFISTFCDATGLIVYFLIAKAVLGV
ncbi:magnesium transporter [Rhodococcus sp. 06-462-5]|uniref:magnesium transporter n=1 Tax=unclassified Rhodococcus (in: high G+C Gram-positive bacteria) TaxID=192944 RepID=UPI000B9B08D7|nr:MULTISPECIES: magnesium transporter [unclassified Rhodococcus (in: high G+C Gram-positive bacteria)]OZC70506.1 magnesium transporter [Rhodococcus sp. 06-462-5]OZE69133.1 magnesium transporter [Rhodococcus sp. 02-925g]